ncbi:hypothetical protein K431DRAFT_104097 [Polychaeton citri CBS 116435]|uniref:Uncharacterized protein n=1 Tax=Polychaeton citri CBS 116435 TaxID=1314669 RepID=A0A9P4Q3K9_9PEZI|nr:hypothetical protein K431DRAFT_104097 [Polychaeton citri CBS 116435]
MAAARMRLVCADLVGIDGERHTGEQRLVLDAHRWVGMRVGVSARAHTLDAARLYAWKPSPPEPQLDSGPRPMRDAGPSLSHSLATPDASVRWVPYARLWCGRCSRTMPESGQWCRIQHSSSSSCGSSVTPPTSLGPCNHLSLRSFNSSMRVRPGYILWSVQGKRGCSRDTSGLKRNAPTSVDTISCWFCDVCRSIPTHTPLVTLGLSLHNASKRPRGILSGLASVTKHPLAALPHPMPRSLPTHTLSSPHSPYHAMEA